jgi:hypothetical protein
MLSKNEPSLSPAADAPRIGVKGFSISAKPNMSKPFTLAAKPKLSSTLGKRPRTALHHDSDGSDDDRPIRHEAVTGFEAGGAVTASGKTKKELLVIPKMKNRDWRDEIRKGRGGKGKNLLPPEVQAQRAGKDMRGGQDVNSVDAEGGEPKWGLTITKKTIVEPGVGVEEAATADGDDGETSIVGNTETPCEPPKEKTDDERAIEALIGIKSEEKGPDLIIPAVNDDGGGLATPATEEDAYRRAIRSAPDVSTLEDYERVPVEEFGAALLRGMGWKEGDSTNGRVERPKDVKRRQNLLGLGATELKGAEELGAWVQKSDPKRLGSGGGRGSGDRRPKANEYREREERKRESRDERYGQSHRRDKDEYRHRDNDRDRRR